jgi:hypothetical protein
VAQFNRLAGAMRDSSAKGAVSWNCGTPVMKRVQKRVRLPEIRNPLGETGELTMSAET